MTSNKIRRSCLHATLTVASYLGRVRLVGLEVGEELQMGALLVERRTVLLAQLQAPAGDGQLVAQPRVLTTHSLYLSLLLPPLGVQPLHATAHRRHHLQRTHILNTRTTALDRGLRSDQPRYHAHARCPPSLLPASAAPHRTLCNASSQLISLTLQWNNGNLWSSVNTQNMPQ